MSMKTQKARARTKLASTDSSLARLSVAEARVVCTHQHCLGSLHIPNSTSLPDMGSWMEVMIESAFEVTNLGRATTHSSAAWQTSMHCQSYAMEHYFLLRIAEQRNVDRI